MKKYIFITLALLCCTTMMAQKPVERTKKIMVYHLADGTQVRTNLYFRNGENYSSWGQYEVNDNDYIKISGISGTNDSHEIHIEFTDHGADRMGGYGVRWSNDRNEIMSGGTDAIKSETLYNDDTYKIDFTEETPIVYDIPYYFRAYVTVMDITYYSEVCEYVFRRELKQCYPYDINAEEYKECGIVMPTDEAFNDAFCQEGDTLSSTSLYTLKKAWNDSYLTPEIAASINKQDAEKIICYECELYMVKSVPEDFVKYIVGDKIIFVPGDNLNYDVDDDNKPVYTKNMSSCELVECDASFGVYENRYWKYVQSSNSANPTVSINMPITLPGYTYNVNLVYAPQTQDTTDVRTNKFKLNLFETEDDGEYPTRGVPIKDAEGNSRYVVDNATKCDTVSFEWEATDMRHCLLQIVANVNSRETATYTREMRVVGVFVERKQK